MNKKELVTLMVNQINNDLTKKEVESVLDAFLEIIKDTLFREESVIFNGFLSLKVKEVCEKSGISFGKEWTSPSKIVPKATFSKSFKDELAKKEI